MVKGLIDVEGGWLVLYCKGFWFVSLYMELHLKG